MRVTNLESDLGHKKHNIWVMRMVLIIMGKIVKLSENLRKLRISILTIVRDFNYQQSDRHV